MAKRKTGAGGKLSRSETVSVRLNPKLRYATELAANKQLRTLSSFIEWAVSEAVQKVILKESDEGEEFVWSAYNAANLIVDVDEADQFCKLALNLPEHLQSFEEQTRWKIICEHKYFWRLYKIGDELLIVKGEGNLIFERVRELWGNIEEIVQGGEDKIPDNKEDFIIGVSPNGSKISKTDKKKRT